MCTFATREESQHYIFLFSAPSLCPQSNVQVLTADTFENSTGPTKCSRKNACMCRLVSAFAAQEKMFCFFSAPICVLNHLLLVSSADSLFKQLGPRSDPAKLSCENGAHSKSRMSLRCWRGKFFLSFKCTFLFFNCFSYFIALSFLAGIRLG